MLKKIKYILLVFVMLFLFIPNTTAEEKVTLYLFWGDGCPHCAAEQEYFKTLQEEFPNLEIVKYEVWHNEENQQLLNQIATKTEKSFTGVPVTIIGQTIITGFSTSTEQELRRTVSYYSENTHHDIVQEIKDGTYEQTAEIPDEEFVIQEKKLDENTTLNLPIIGEINFKNFDLMTAIPILGLLASFSLPVLWLIITYTAAISLQKEKKDKLILLPIGLLLIGITSILTAKIEIEAIKWIARIIIIIISALLAIESLQKIKIPKPLQKIILLLLAIAIGLTASPIYSTIVSTLLETNDISTIMNIVIHIGYLIAYIIPYIIILLICHIPWKKLPEHGKQGVQISIMIATILVILFI